MGIAEDLRGALTSDAVVASLVGGRIFPGDIPPHTTPTPWVFFAIPEEVPTDELNADGSERLTVEFELFAETFAEANALKLAVKSALHKWRGGEVNRCLWAGTDYTAVEDGHNITVRFMVWASSSATIPTPGGNARVVTGAGVIYFYPTGGPLPAVSIDSLGRIIGDGSQLTNLPAPNLSDYARKSLANTFGAANLFTGGLSSLGTGANQTSERFGLNAVSGGHYSTVLGRESSASGGQDTVVGAQSSATSSTGVVVIGAAATGTSDAIVIGKNASATARGIVIGQQAVNGGIQGVTIGLNAVQRNTGEFTYCWDTGASSVSTWLIQGRSSTSTTRDLFRIAPSWVVSTDASRATRVAFSVFSVSTEQEGVRIEANAAGVRLSFYGQPAVARQTLPAAGVVTAADIRTALINLGLCQ